MLRRDFILKGGLAGAALRLGDFDFKPESKQAGNDLKIKKCLKIDMVQDKIPLLDKFRLLKELGFDGVEMNSPNDLDPGEVLNAKEKCGLEIAGVVNSLHWEYPLSDPDSSVREKCVKGLEQSILDCKLYGGTSVLLVPAVVNRPVSYKDAYERSQKEIRKVLKTLEKTNVTLAFENVWNDFLLSPLEAARYVDDFNHPLIAWHFDVGNVLIHGWPEHWIKILGSRIVKLDVKEYSRDKQEKQGTSKGFDVELMEGDCNWPAVIKALKNINFNGWASAEVPGGDRARLSVIKSKMDAIFK